MNTQRPKIAFPEIAAEVTQALLGEPNRALFTPNELRFGSRGSLSVDLKQAVWHDHENGTGGGLLDLIARETGASKGGTFDWLRERGFAPAEQTAQGRREIVTTYPYHDEAGLLLFEVCRFKPKDFRQRAPDGCGGWNWSTKGVRRVLYHLPEIIAAPGDALVFIVEGERDADHLAELGLVATTCPEGAGKWRDDFAKALTGRRVTILPDNDDAGRDHAAAVLKSIRAAGIESAVLTLDGLPHKGDVSDWLAAGGDVETLSGLAEAALREAPAAEAPRLPTAFVWRDPSTIPPRPWLYGHHLIRRQVSVTVAPGGVGKSSLTIAEALAMASGRDLLGEWVAGRLKIWIFNLEDPRDELERRITAAMLHHRIAPEEVEGRLYVDTGRERDLCTAVQTREGAQILAPVFDELHREITAREIDVLIVDPFVSSHQVSENDNGAIDLVAKQWARLADRCDCAIELVHHTRKTNGEEATTESGRGATALLAAARSGRVLNKMGEDMKAEAGVQDDPATYFAVTRDKANLAPVGKRVWRRMASVALGNGDSVGVAEAWEWPDTFDGVTPADLLDVQQAVDKRCQADDPPRYSDQAGKEWAGNLVAETLGLDVSNDRKRIKRIIETWLKSGALVKGQKTGPIRKPVPTIEVGKWATQ